MAYSNYASGSRASFKSTSWRIKINTFVCLTISSGVTAGQNSRQKSPVVNV
jgi:hypothetical protein